VEKVRACSPHHLCNCWRDCDRCAKIRSARIADIAEKLEKQTGQLCFAVCKPDQNTAASIRSLRDRIVRSKLSPAGIWTIETGELFAGLHLNLLTQGGEREMLRNAGFHVETITTCARMAAAYISKKSGFPTVQQYPGRLFGKWGKIGEILLSSCEQTTACAQAALLESVLQNDEQRRIAAEGWRAVVGGYTRVSPPQPEKTAAEYKRIAEKNLPNLLAAMGRSTIPNQIPAALPTHPPGPLPEWKGEQTKPQQQNGSRSY